MEDARRWADKYRNRTSILRIAQEEGVDAGTVSKWLKKIGVEFRAGQHFVEQPPLHYSKALLSMSSDGPERVISTLKEKVWGIQASLLGKEQLVKFCRFVNMHQQGAGVVEIAQTLGVHRSTVAEWRKGTDQPYLIKALDAVIKYGTSPHLMLVPLQLESGGNLQSNWIRVPPIVTNYSDITEVVNQLVPREETFIRALRFGIQRDQLISIQPELFAYLLGIMLGDAGKPGGELERFTSMNLDLQLSQKEPSNEKLGEFVCMCANALGIAMRRTLDKMPTGDTRLAENPAAAFRWISSRSPLFAWMFNVCLGLEMNELTSVSKVRMDWILSMPRAILLRFIQGLSDSDATVRRYVVEIASMPNAEFVTGILSKLGVTSARTLTEHGQPMRSSLLNSEAASLPIFNEFVKGYRYQALMRYAGITESGPRGDQAIRSGTEVET
jgi:transposase-like protein